MKLSWQSNQQPYQAGVDRGVLYSPDGLGLAWNGLRSVAEDESSVETSKVYIDRELVLVNQKAASPSGTITAYTYPPILDIAPSRSFGFSYRVMTESGYDLYILYGMKLTPSGQTFGTTSDQNSPVDFSWKTIATHRVVISSQSPSCEPIEDVLYGGETDPYLPPLEDLQRLADEFATLKITDHGDGTWSADGPDDVVIVHGDGTFTIDSPTVRYVDGSTYTVSSY